MISQGREKLGELIDLDVTLQGIAAYFCCVPSPFWDMVSVFQEFPKPGMAV